MPILTENQQRILALIADDTTIAGYFYLSGGTALAEYYLQHRLSEDLDFFAEEEFDPQAISAFFKKMQDKAGITSITYEQSFNRNLFFLAVGTDTIKTEFTYFPFPRIEQKNKIGKLGIDSLLDITVNKIFTIYQKPRSRDFIDLYCILQKEKDWMIDELVQKAQIKFDNYLDPLQLAAQFTKAETLKDYPKLLIPLLEKEWQSFFIQEAKRLGKTQIE
ncbi:MAG: nucleotidyl transferase AbiEii/AbiGii toxin family protein [Patescibacteria group bacterium]